MVLNALKNLCKIQHLFLYFFYGPFGLSEKGGEVEESRIELAENKLILGQFYSILLYSPSLLSIQTDS